MFDERSTNFDLPPPNKLNPLNIDVERLRASINQLDTLLKNIETASNAAVHYAGDWDASANTPEIPAADTANKGSFYLPSTRTPGDGARHRRISESLLALALVEPTQYVTHEVNIPDTCPAI